MIVRCKTGVNVYTQNLENHLVNVLLQYILKNRIEFKPELSHAVGENDENNGRLAQSRL